DLTQRKLIPALYNLAAQNFLPDDFALVGIARRAMTDDQFRRKALEGIEEFVPKPVDPQALKRLSDRLHYMAGDASDRASYGRLGEAMAKLDPKRGAGGNNLFYLATAPEFFGPIARRLGDSGLTREERGNWRRVVVEKPFGRDLESAKNLNEELKSVLHESQIYRIDHYLGKETVQNLMVFRFANGIFEPIWNRNYVDHVQISVAEELGVGSRGGYFDGVGVLRDMVPNHLFQLLSLTAMEPPSSFDANVVRDRQLEVLRSISPLTDEDVWRQAVRGQYDGYRKEALVAPDSITETYAALKLSLDTWRWAGVPFYLRTGKRLAARSSEIVIQFRAAPVSLFRGAGVTGIAANQLVIRIQPHEGIALSFGAKIPGPTVQLGTVDMDFKYQDYFGAAPSTGYERLLYEAMLGDQTLFQRADMVETAWGVVQPLLDAWRAAPGGGFPNYAGGSWGPDAAEQLLERDGRKWRECAGS
ncbi:MAG: glucose-6-phosphate dehydrogenase, partial [Elusimicrobia bacterium]|nr:glucose-6-phosphate dehydrogenase [Elusimicrobiota bacterium]